MERKTFQTAAIKLDEAQGIVEHIIAVMGNLDMGNDIIHNGAFAKTISERGTKVRVLDAHNTDSIMRVLGKPRSMREIGKHELPSDLLMKYPDANGALLVETQYLMNTPEGKGAFERIQSGAVDEYSIGYDPLDFDYSEVLHDGKKVTARNLRTLKLYEYSPVLWAMNPATATLSAKEKLSEAEPSEGKPWNVFKEDGKWRVYKLDTDGKPTGEPLGEHDTEEEARAQVRALYANEGKEDKAPMKTEADGEHPASHYLVVEDPEKVDTWHLRVRGMDGKPDHNLMGGAWAALHSGYRGNVYEGPGKQDAIRKLRAMYTSEDMDMPSEGEKAMDDTEIGKMRRMRAMMEEMAEMMNEMMDGEEHPKSLKAGRIQARRNADRLKQIYKLLRELADDGGLEFEETEEMDAPEGAAKIKQQGTGAGPLGELVRTAPTQEDMLILIELGLAEINLLEV